MCLPPCGGSGLKSLARFRDGVKNSSPSMRREWIEIQFPILIRLSQSVSLHAEGVD